MLTGKSTTLRALDRSDLVLATRWLNDAKIRGRIASYKPMSMAEQERWYERTIGGNADQVFAIDVVIEQQRAMIGMCGIHDIQWKHRCASVGILIGDAVNHRRGFGTDAMSTLVHYAHDELGLHRVALEVFTDNAAAIASYRNVGFVEEGVRRGAMFRQGRFKDLLQMSILPGEQRAPSAL